MIRDDHGDLFPPVRLAAQPGDAHCRPQEGMRGDPAETADYPGPDRGDLRLQIRQACGDLVRVRLPVLGRTAFHAIGDETPRSREADGRQPRVQVLSRCADKRTSRGVFISSRSLPNKEDGRIKGTFPRDRHIPVERKPAFHAGRDFRCDRRQAAGAIGRPCAGRHDARGGQHRRRYRFINFQVRMLPGESRCQPVLQEIQLLPQGLRRVRRHRQPFLETTPGRERCRPRWTGSRHP